LRAAIAAFTHARDDWQATPVGGAMALTWRQPKHRR
jgi:hypothetical protein